jgi:hypothetical protein
MTDDETIALCATVTAGKLLARRLHRDLARDVN